MAHHYDFQTTSWETKDVECVCGWVGTSISVENNHFRCGGCKKWIYIFAASHEKFKAKQRKQLEQFLSERGFDNFIKLQQKLAIIVGEPAEHPVLGLAITLFVGAEGAPVDSYPELWRDFIKNSNLKGVSVRRGIGSGVLFAKPVVVAKQNSDAVEPSFAAEKTRFNLLEIE